MRVQIITLALGAVGCVAGLTACVGADSVDAARPQASAGNTLKHPSWTGLDSPDRLITARRSLMLSREDQMLPIDLATVEDTFDTFQIRANATTIAAMLEATAHLFPPTTDRYDADAATAETLALPTIWENFAAFSAMAEAAVSAAQAVTKASDDNAIRSTATGLRATCDACHGLFLRPYVPAQVSDEDRDFDFDALFEN